MNRFYAYLWKPFVVKALAPEDDEELPAAKRRKRTAAKRTKRTAKGTGATDTVPDLYSMYSASVPDAANEPLEIQTFKMTPRRCRAGREI